MKKLYIIRHAKAQRDNPNGDFGRDLCKRGEDDIKEMSIRLKNRKIKPDAFVSSAALRTARTARLLAKAFSFDEKKIVFEKKLYEADENKLFEYIKRCDDKYNELCIIGHNPALRELCELLSTIYLSSFPTSSVFALEFEVESFADIKAHSGKLVFFECIKKLKDGSVSEI